MEFVTFLGIILGIGSLVGGAVLEGLHISSIAQPTAALIVFGGTLGAVFVSFPSRDIKKAISSIGIILAPFKSSVADLIEEVTKIATVARKDGILAVEQQRSSIVDPVFRRSIKYVVDGFDPPTVREIMQAEIEHAYEEEEAAARVWEGAGGYSPTIGIIGAVLGLIHVMSGLKDPNFNLGGGIAVAFVATIYGVASANLIFIPFGTKLKRKAALSARKKEIIKIGVCGIQDGMNPAFLKEKMEIYAKEKI